MNNNNKEITLKNFEIKEMTDVQGRVYYLLVNNENRDEAYFCFKSIVKSGWEILESGKYPSELVIEYEESEQSGKIYRRVVILSSVDDMFI